MNSGFSEPRSKQLRLCHCHLEHKAKAIVFDRDVTVKGSSKNE
jgi:hypothetical protein